MDRLSQDAQGPLRAIGAMLGSKNDKTEFHNLWILFATTISARVCL
jgi:hypothetical protein